VRYQLLLALPLVVLRLALESLQVRMRVATELLTLLLFQLLEPKIEQMIVRKTALALHLWDDRILAIGMSLLKEASLRVVPL
jgi:hypothetical protein